MKRHTYFALLALSCIVFNAQPNLGIAANTVFSENIIYIQPDGKSYVIRRSASSDWSSYNLFFDKNLSLDEFYYIYPNQYTWDTKSAKDSNSLKFNAGEYVVIYRDKFDKELSIDKNKIYTYKSWDGVKNNDGRYGFWNAPNNYSSFVFVWIVPDNFDIISYQSSQNGKWVKRHNSITFFSTNSNNLTFEIRYKERDTDNDCVTDDKNSCLETVQAVRLNKQGNQTAPTVDNANAQLSKNIEPARPNQFENIDLSSTLPTILEGVYFHTGSSKLLVESFQTLDMVVLILKQNPLLKIEIRGHTDTTGNSQSNLRLSQQRAEAVLNYLISKEVATNQVIANGYGEMQAIGDNKTKDGRQQNRRVEILRIQ